MDKLVICSWLIRKGLVISPIGLREVSGFMWQACLSFLDCSIVIGPLGIMILLPYSPHPSFIVSILGLSLCRCYSSWIRSWFSFIGALPWWCTFMYILMWSLLMWALLWSLLMWALPWWSPLMCVLSWSPSLCLVFILSL